MRELDTTELDIISGGDRIDTYYRIGAEVANWYNAAVSATTDLFEYVLG